MLDSIKQKLKQINPIDSTIYKKAGVLILLLHENDKEDISKFKPLIKLYDRADIINDIA